MLLYIVIHVGFLLLTPRPFRETKLTHLFFPINVSRYVLTIDLISISCLENINNVHCVNLLCKVIFNPTHLDSSWWYSIWIMIHTQ